MKSFGTRGIGLESLNVKCIEFWGQKGWREKDPFSVGVVLASMDSVIKRLVKHFLYHCRYF